MAAFFRFWTRQAETRPFTTIAATEACLSACGDLIAQTVGRHLSSNPTQAEETTGYDLVRTSRFVLFAMCLSPVGVNWHRFLDRRFPIRTQTAWFGKAKRKKPPVSASAAALAARAAKRRHEQMQAARQVAKRLVCDVLLFEPSMYFVFFGSMALMEGGGLAEVRFRISNLLLPTYLTGLTISPIIQTINFAYIPLIYRVPFSSSFDLFWDTYLSWVNNEKRAMIVAKEDADIAGE
ncbi:hypothetical protein GGF46_004937 [Coemansia sp. RSA 552]|nr:hypothetical protein GGF46_004937 [Coemansia sp. RSA 552]